MTDTMLGLHGVTIIADDPLEPERWRQVPEPESPVFYGVLPSTQRIWLQGQLRPEHPLHYDWELDQLRRSGEQRTLVCVDLEPEHKGLYFEGKSGQWWWQTSHFRNLFWDDREFDEAVKAAVCEPGPPAVEGPELPWHGVEPPAWAIATMTSRDTYALVSSQKHPGKDRFHARKGWVRR